MTHRKKAAFWLAATDGAKTRHDLLKCSLHLRRRRRSARDAAAQNEDAVRDVCRLGGPSANK